MPDMHALTLAINAWRKFYYFFFETFLWKMNEKVSRFKTLRKKVVQLVFRVISINRYFSGIFC